METGLGILIAIVAAFTTFLFNVLYSKINRRRDNIKELASDLIDRIETLETDAVSYWLHTYNAEQYLEFKKLEYKIKSNIRKIRSKSRTFIECVGERKNKQLVDHINGFNDYIFDLVTGDDFESKVRRPSEIKADKISNSCSLIQSKISDFSYK